MSNKKSNIDRPWINFEAGALAKSIDRAETRVVPLLIDWDGMKGLPAPLNAYNGILASKSGFKKLILSTNNALPKSRPEERVSATFEKWWTDLELSIARAKRELGCGTAETEPSTQQLLSEILSLVRGLARSPSSVKSAARVGSKRSDALERREAKLINAIMHRIASGYSAETEITNLEGMLSVEPDLGSYDEQILRRVIKKSSE